MTDLPTLASLHSRLDFHCDGYDETINAVTRSLVSAYLDQLESALAPLQIELSLLRLASPRDATAAASARPRSRAPAERLRSVPYPARSTSDAPVVVIVEGRLYRLVPAETFTSPPTSPSDEDTARDIVGIDGGAS